jgi:hypothetical protein
MRDAAVAVAKAIPGAASGILDGQGHDVAPEVLAPAVRDFVIG